MQINDLASTTQSIVWKKIENRIYDAIHEQIEEAKKEVIEKAVQEFQARIRQLVANVALNTSNFYTLHNMGNELLIKVKIENDHKP